MIRICGIVFTLIIGTLLHFTFEWSGRNLLIAFLAPTNESVFEHLKLLMTPYLLWALNEYVHYGQFTKSFIPAKTLGLLAGMLIIVVLFYAYTAVVGRSILPVDIGLFVLSVFTAFAVDKVLMDLEWMGALPVRIAAGVLLFLLALAFAVFTVYPPRYPIFNSPVPSPKV